MNYISIANLSLFSYILSFSLPLIAYFYLVFFILFLSYNLCFRSIFSQFYFRSQRIFFPFCSSSISQYRAYEPLPLQKFVFKFYFWAARSFQFSWDGRHLAQFHLRRISFKMQLQFAFYSLLFTFSFCPLRRANFRCVPLSGNFSRD